MKRILIIDDDDDILETTGALLTHEGFDVHSAATVEEGIRLIGELQPIAQHTSPPPAESGRGAQPLGDQVQTSQACEEFIVEIIVYASVGHGGVV